MAPRTSWKGFLKLSLVSVPVKAFTANNTSEEIRLNQLHQDCNSRVRYKKVCPEHGELKQDEIVSGYEYQKDSYVIVESDEVGKLRTQSDKAVHIDGFVGQAEIDPRFLAGRTYYLMPDGVAGNRPYALLIQGMLDNDVVAVAQVVISGREQLVMLRPEDGMLVMSVLHFPKKVKAMEPFKEELTEEKLTKEELNLTNTLIGASKIEEFDFDKYKDAYVENLSKLIQLKIDGEEIVQAPDLEEPKIINLMDALKKSVAEAGARKMAPSVKSASKKAEAKTAEADKAKKTTRKRKTG
jgi:DNA end-binding protein Ku